MLCVINKTEKNSKENLGLKSFNDFSKFMRLCLAPGNHNDHIFLEILNVWQSNELYLF